MEQFATFLEWERAVLLELNSEHEYVCRIHKVSLRPVAIILFSSETRWGQFDPVTRTISISIRLVREFPWHDVVGVFRHEMAHQLVYEESMGKIETRMHGEVFKEACGRLGVPDLYSRAGVDLTSSSFDWRNEIRDPKTEAVLDKVRKLLALADSSNEHEALLAIEKVRELYAKYNLELSESLRCKGFVHLVLNYGKKKLPSWFLCIGGILSEHFFVRTIVCREYDQDTGLHFGAIEVIGRKENVLMAEHVYHFLLQQLDLLVEKKAKMENGLTRRDRNSYRLGILAGFSRKLEGSKISSTKDPVHSSKALEILKMNDEVDAYMGTIYPKLRKRSGGSIRVNGEAYASGESAGMSLQFHRPVDQSPGGQKYLLGRST